MLVAAALIPETALLVPGAAGRTDSLGDLRAAALDAVAAVLRTDPELVVIASGGSLAAGSGPPRGPHPALRPSLAAAGIADTDLGWVPDGDGPVVQDVGAAVALLLLARSGWDGPVEVLGPPAGQDRAPDRGAVLREHGRRAVLAAPSALPAPRALLLAGSMSARSGPLAPLAPDDRAEAFDRAVLADLVDLGPAARARLAAVPQERAEELAVSGWAPWQVLLGATGEGRGWDGRLHADSAALGMCCAVVEWQPAERPPGGLR